MNELAQFLERYFGLAKSSNHLELSYEHLHKVLTDRIIYLIRVDIDKLLQALYRIDVAQKYTDEAFSKGEVGLVASSLSEHIIKRQLKKLDYRSNHSF
ncbi:MAG: hypothetical protein N4A33_10260 [Bacteriovoracaceae bacterium]|nr:hypothetical protein [Bacteriovoracaceae bacterium]